MIKSLNIDYSGPIDGLRYFGSHQGTKTFTNKKAKFLHVITTKERIEAEENQVKYHAPG
jgi:deoxyxylulose-5-phosphate synthase